MHDHTRNTSRRRDRLARRALLALVVGIAAVTAGAAPARSQVLEATTPVTGIVAVSTGDTHSCAVTTEQHLLCWGGNEVGQLGIGTASPREGVHEVQNRTGTGPLTGVTAVAVGSYHSCALLASHEVRCWGTNGFEQLGDGTGENRNLPVVVLDAAGGRLHDVVQLTAGGGTTCAVLASQEARCWGNNDDGEVGLGTGPGSYDRAQPVRAVAGPGRLTGVTQIEAGSTAVCARLSSGEARCWGSNGTGQIGDGTNTTRLRPVVVRNAAGTGPLTGVRRVSVGDHHTCALRTDGTARCWGTDTAGQLGDGANANHALPVTVVADATRAPLRGITAVTAGSTHTCALLTSGQVRCWGQNALDQLGNGLEAGPALNLPSVVRNRNDSGNLTGVTQLSTSTNHTCVRLGNGQSRCWGAGVNGQLGDLGVANRPLPRVVVEETVN